MELARQSVFRPKKKVLEDIKELKEFLKVIAGDIYVKGSFVRGEPFEDIDIQIFNSGETILKDAPHSFRGKQISYKQTPPENLEDYFSTCLRSTSSLLEMVELSSIDPLQKQLIKKCKQETLSKKIAHYILFLHIEEKISRRNNTTPVGSYAYLKRTKGSKRTISRMLWAHKVMYSELTTERNTYYLIQRLYSKGYIPKQICEDALDVLIMLSNPKQRGGEVWNSKTSHIAKWFDDEFTSMSKEYVARKLQTEYINLINKAMSTDTPPKELSNILNCAESPKFAPYEKWLVLFVLSANPKLNHEEMYNIISKYQKHHCYTNIIRNIIRNPESPVSIFEKIDTSIDSYLRKLLIEKKKLKK